LPARAGFFKGKTRMSAAIDRSIHAAAGHISFFKSICYGERGKMRMPATSASMTAASVQSLSLAARRP